MGKWFIFRHILLYGVAILVIRYEDRSPIVRLDWRNFIGAWHTEWNYRKGIPGEIVINWRTPGLMSPYRWLKNKFEKPDPDQFDY